MLYQSFDPQLPERHELFHSSGYVQSKGMGSTSRETFQQRRLLDRNRSTVKRYKGVSHIDDPHPKSADSSPKIPIRQKPKPHSVTRTQIHFREPSSRHNPHA